MLLRRIIFFSPVLLTVLFSCSTKKNALPNRVYHNITARYNGYYYSNESIDDGEFKIDKSNKDNFEKILPVYVYPTQDKVKSTFPEFDKAIKKSSMCIQKHAIKDKKGNEIPTAGKWIDNNWINIGKSQFYKREFFSAIETFEYVIRNYNKSEDKFTAMVWLIKAYNEIGSVSNAEPILSLLKNERKLPRKIKNELPVLWADYYVRRGQYTEATAKLMEATRNSKFLFGLPKKRRARYSFIIAQLLEINKDNKRAIGYYKKTISLKPNYEMVFYSKIKIARLIDVKRTSSEKTKKGLLKMSREFKNSDYYDVIFYTLGEIEEKERHIDQALIYYKKSVLTSVNNPNQKALSYLKLGEINFDLTNYQPAEAYYDSTIATLPKDHPDYNSILARKKTLETLVGHIKTISREDSLQRIAKMSEKDRDAFADKLIANYIKEQDRIKKEKEAAALAAQTNTMNTGGMNAPPPGFGGNSANWYFYNPSTVAFGVSDFQRRWGNRKFEDNWRRSNKAVVLTDEEEVKKDSSLVKRDTGYVPEKTREFYLKNLPISDSALKKSNARMIKAYYMMGSIYKEDLNDTKKTIASFEELNTRFPNNKYTLNTYYILYRIYLDAKNTPKADYYKEKILNEFPDSEFAALIKNPSYAQELSAQKSEVEAFYTEVYEAYAGSEYSKSFSKSNEGIKQFGKSDYLPKFEFIRAMSVAKLRGTDSLEQNLKLIVAKYPSSEVVGMSNDIIAAIQKQKKPMGGVDTAKTFQNNQPARTDTFNLNLETTHMILAVVPDDGKIPEAFKTNIGFFNTIYYNGKTFEVTSTLFGDKKQLVLVKSFTDAKTAMSYYENLSADTDVFKGDVKRELVEMYPISADNLPYFYKSKNLKGYKVFFEANYKKLGAKN
ncbi:MAG: tetratricopeptide repeat protein [Bacteroidia bacterium]|nr:tetratricopeptide repeat protein [Bacteroidia bacterium]